MMQIAIPHIARLRVILILTPSLYVFSFLFPFSDGAAAPKFKLDGALCYAGALLGEQ